jgi:IS1 family transposase
MDLMNRLNNATRSQIIKALVDGCSIRATERLTGVGKKAITRLLVSMGEVCVEYQSKVMKNLTCKRIQCDEIWSYIGAKQKNVALATMDRGAIGDVWTWTAIDADTKLIPTWLVGSRDAESADVFIRDLAGRLANRVQLTTDGHKPYLNAVEGAFRTEDTTEVDYALLVKIYGNSPENEKRYSPAECTGCKREVVFGDPDPRHISTSYVERQNLTMRMSMRRFTRLTNAFSKKVENHAAAVAVYFMYYNFVRVHQTLRMTPAMAAGVATKLWEVSDMVALLEAKEKKQPE